MFQYIFILFYCFAPSKNSLTPSLLTSKNTIFQNKILQYIWCSNPKALDDSFNEYPKNLIILLSNGTLFRSEDQGSSFIELPLNKTITYMYQNPTFNNMLYFENNQKLYYYSQNCGFEIKKIENFGFLIDKFIFNHGESKYIIIKSLKKEYFLSDDNGLFWKKIDSLDNNTIKFIDWGYNHANMQEFNNIKRIFVQINNETIYTDDFFQTNVSIKKNVVSMVLNARIIVLSCLEFENNEYIYKIFIVDIFLLNKDNNKNIQEAYFLKKLTYDPIKYVFLELDQIIYLAMGPEEINLTLFSSKVQSEHNFILMIDNILSTRQIHVVKSLTGIILVNQFSDILKIRTLISFNKGTTWQYLKLEQNNQTLNLDLQTIYTTKSSIGLILSYGNIGERLIPLNSNLYLSRNSGFSWFELKKGKHLYAISDLGSFIILIDPNQPTNQLQFSWDQGLSFENYNFSENLINVTNLTIEPNIFSQKVIVFGENIITSQQLIISMSFSQRICQGIWAPDTIESDYETWDIKKEFGSCHLGEHISIIRRKRSSDCLNPELDRPSINRYCECTDRDYQCDYGFEFNLINNQCEKNEEISKLYTYHENYK